MYQVGDKVRLYDSKYSNSFFEGKRYVLSNIQKNDIYRYLINNISLWCLDLYFHIFL